MDRDNRWERVSKAWFAMIKGQGEKTAATAQEAVDQSYADEVIDEFILPTVIGDYAGVADGDGFFCMNFRADRAREILRAIGEPEFAEFDTGPRPALSALLGMVEYSDDHNAYMTTCFPKREIVNTLGDWVSKHGKTQFRLAETEKYPHVTFFLDGGVEKIKPGEDRYMPKSPKVATYDLQPEMSSVRGHGQVRRGDRERLRPDRHQLRPTPTWWGHTGSIPAAVAACEAVDRGLGRVVEALEKAGGALIVTADHGNCETMVDPETGGPHTAHTTNPVPVILFGGPEGAALREGRLADLAPTLLELMGMEKPAEMTGESLIK